MVLRYMVSDTDLVKVEFKKPEKEVKQPRRKNVQPKRNRPSSKKSVKLKLFLMVILILGIAVYYLWTADLTSFDLESLPTNKEVVVTSIVYSEQIASAVVSDRIVHDGDMIDGYKVVKIHRDEVELEKDGESYIKQVNNLRIPLTQRLINMRNSIISTISRWKRQLESKL